MKVEVTIRCPDCFAKISLYGKIKHGCYMVFMGNADWINIRCDKCEMEFLISEEDYDRLKEKYKVN